MAENKTKIRLDRAVNLFIYLSIQLALVLVVAFVSMPFSMCLLIVILQCKFVASLTASEMSYRQVENLDCKINGKNRKQNKTHSLNRRMSVLAARICEHQQASIW